MANVTQIANIKALAAYLPDGVWKMIDAMIPNLPLDIRLADNLNLYAFAGLSTTKQEIADAANSRPILIIAQSTGTACWIHFYNADADDVTVGVNVDFVVPLAGTNGEVTVLLCVGASWARFWATGLTVSASTATETSAAPTNTPNLWVVNSTS